MTRSTAVAVASLLLFGADWVAAQPAPVDGQELRVAIDQLGDFDYDTRTAAASAGPACSTGARRTRLLAAVRVS